MSSQKRAFWQIRLHRWYENTAEAGADRLPSASPEIQGMQSDPDPADIQPSDLYADLYYGSGKPRVVTTKKTQDESVEQERL